MNAGYIVMRIATPLTAKIRANPPHPRRRAAVPGLGWPTLEWLEQTVTQEMTTLETGSGGSTIVFAGAKSKHTAISPDPEEHANIRGSSESSFVL